MKLERILAIAGIILLLLITVLSSTPIQIFSRRSSEDKQAASVEEKPLSSPKPKDGKMDFGRGSGKRINGGGENSKQDDENTPAMKFVKEVHKSILNC